MKFDKPAETNPIDNEKVVSQPTPRIEGPLKVTGTATYAYEQDKGLKNVAYGYIVGSAIAKGTIENIDISKAQRAPGVLNILTYKTIGSLGKAGRNNAHLLAGPNIEHYHQAMALVVAETFEQARSAANLIHVKYKRSHGQYSLVKNIDSSVRPERITGGPAYTSVGDFDGAFSNADVTLDQTYGTSGHAHAMMEPPASVAIWEDNKLTIYTSHQMINWALKDIATTLNMPIENIRVNSPFIGGGFGGKLFVRADAMFAALAARATKRPVKVTMTRPFMFNNMPHRAATIQRVRIGTDKAGKITAIGHENWSGDINAKKSEAGVRPTRMLYAGANRMTEARIANLNLAEANAMRAPGEAPGSMVLEVAMDEMAETLGMDPIDFRILNDTQVVGENPDKPFSQRRLKECLQRGAREFGWRDRPKTPGETREGDWLIGMGVAAAFRNAPVQNSAARVKLTRGGAVIVETDMTDIGTGSYTIIGQTAAEMLGVPLSQVTVRLGDSDSPVSAGSGGQWGAASSTSGVYAACLKLREKIAEVAGLDPKTADFVDASISDASNSYPLRDIAKEHGELTAEDTVEFGDLQKQFQVSSFGSHFIEVGVHVVTGEVRLRRMLAVAEAGRILNPTSARNQMIGAMTMGAGAALMEDLVVDEKVGFFVNHDLAGYEVPVHADIPQQQVIFLEDEDPKSSPVKAKGVGELGICGVGAAIANAVYNATGVRVRQYPITLDKLIHQLPDVV
ncbi:aldehyde oxidoreductase molybdenum-binding subunit PaoC [Halioxenophilus aromaticivorans]|uniref:Aldehyde oxidoreductase molybdenum-binding subunit PaoC n=1 Tax=Halioxenophilus aromaticivorans TaxID=1306992 RepID=A0AAV3TWE4_9ALTE